MSRKVLVPPDVPIVSRATGWREDDWVSPSQYLINWWLRAEANGPVGELTSAPVLSPFPLASSASCRLTSSISFRERFRRLPDGHSHDTPAFAHGAGCKVSTVP
jgi:hypothetical protein